MYEANIKLFEGFEAESKTPVRPYQNLLNNRTIVFDGNLKPVKELLYRRVGGAILYEPRNAKEFTPENFSCTATIQKQVKYDPTEEYDITVGIVEKNNHLELASNLISIFGDAYKRGTCPHNIKINSGSVLRETFIAAAEKSPDFIFVETSDGKNFNGLNVKEMIDRHINIWISSSEWNNGPPKTRPSYIKEEGYLNSFYLKTERKSLSSYFFDEGDKYNLLKEKEYTYSYPYEDVILIEKKDRGFIIVTPSDFIKNCRKNAKVIYDILTYIYFRAYKKSKPASSWITDEPVDYTAYSQMALKIYHMPISLDSMLVQNSYDIRDRYRLINVETTNSKVSFVGMTPEKNLLFRKNVTTDPVKNTDAVSYLTSKNTVILYKEEELYLLSSRAEITGRTTNGKNYIIVAPMRNSIRAIFSDEVKELEVPDINLVYYVCTRQGNAFSKNEFKLIEQSTYSMVEHGHRIAEVRFYPRYDMKIIDIRTPGGGLPSQEEDNFNLIDIGNLYGRPYRIGSTLIIRLPKKLETHKNKIRKAINQHIVAGEYPVLIFE